MLHRTHRDQTSFLKKAVLENSEPSTFQTQLIENQTYWQDLPTNTNKNQGAASHLLSSFPILVLCWARQAHYAWN